MYRLIDTFTTRDGRWEVDEREYGLDQEHLQRYGADAPHLGGATHIFAKTEGGPSNTIRFFTRDNQHSFPIAEKANGWAEFGLTHDNATYKPNQGEVGWWNVQVEGAPSDIVEGIGLPYSWHVSTFLVFGWDETDVPEGPPDPVEPPPTVGEDHIQIFINGLLVFEKGGVGSG